MHHHKVLWIWGQQASPKGRRPPGLQYSGFDSTFRSL